MSPRTVKILIVGIPCAFIVIGLASMVYQMTPRNSPAQKCAGMVLAAILMPLTIFTVYHQEKRDQAYYNRRNRR